MAGEREAFVFFGSDKYERDFQATKQEIEFEREKSTKSMKRIYKIVSDFILRHFHFATMSREENSKSYIYKDGLYVQEAFVTVDKITHEILDEAYSGHSPTAVLDHIKAQSYVNEEDFLESNPYLIPLENGILNVQTRELLDFDPKYHFFTKIPVTYDPEARNPDIIEFFDQVLAEPEDVFLLQQIFGYCLLRDYRFNKFFVFCGEGRNGKGVTLNLLNRLLGTENTSHHSLFSLSENKFMVAELYNKLANINADLPQGEIKDTGILKQLTGGDRVSSDRKFLLSLSFKNYAKLIFSTNNMPKFTDNSVGWKKRWVLLNFKETFFTKNEIKELPEEEQDSIKEADPQLLDRICTPENMSSLLNWALDGLEALLEDGCFSTTRTEKQMWKEIMMRSDPYIVFVEDMLEEDSFRYISKSAMRKFFTDWCKENKLPIKMEDKKLKAALEKLPYHVWEEQKREANMDRCWCGVKIKD